MTMQIDTTNQIILDGRPTGFGVAQTPEGTVVSRSGEQLDLPAARYSLSHQSPQPMHATKELAAKHPAPLGRHEFERDFRAAAGL